MQTLIFFAQNLHNALFVIFNLLNFSKNIFVKLSSENPRVGGSIPSPSTIKSLENSRLLLYLESFAIFYFCVVLCKIV